MSDEPSQRWRHSGVLLRAMLRDLHFWIPVLVLAAGLLVLRWVS